MTSARRNRQRTLRVAFRAGVRRGVLELPWCDRSGWGARYERAPGTGTRRQRTGLYCIAERMEWRLSWSEPVGQPDEGRLYDRHAEAQVTLDARSCACGVNRETEGLGAEPTARRLACESPGSAAGFPTAPPQSRTSAINASGSSGYGFARVSRACRCNAVL